MQYHLRLLLPKKQIENIISDILIKKQNILKAFIAVVMKIKIRNINLLILSFIKTVVLKPTFFVPVFLFSFISYFFSMANRTISIDDLSRDIYYGAGNGKISGTRWGQLLFIKIFSDIKISPFFEQFIGLLFLIFSSIIICTIFNQIRKRKIITYSLFTSLFITFPLMNEIWVYNEACIPLGASLVIMSYIALLIYDNNKTKTIEYILMGIVASIPMSSCEMVIFAYVTIVISILLLKNKESNYENYFYCIKDGIQYAIPLVFAIFVRYIMGFILIKIFNTNYLVNGEGNILWFNNPLECLFRILKYTFIQYILSAISYFPIFEYVLSIIVFVLYMLKNRRIKNNTFLSLLFILSPHLLTIVRGATLPYRCGMPLQYFVAFVLFLISSEFENNNKKILNVSIEKVAIVLMLFICFRQSVCLHEILALNNQRSDNEAFIAREIGYKIYSECDKNKKVIVCGEYQIGNFIEEQITMDENSFAGKIEMSLRKMTGIKEDTYYRKYIQTNINSHLNWAREAFDSQEMIKECLSYYGYDVRIDEKINDDSIEKYEKLAANIKMKPFEVREFNDYILVYLGPHIEK